jgi:hypothetical protein
VTNDATRRDRCSRASRLCELLSELDERHDERCAQEGITTRQALIDAAAVGLVIEVWRNSPVEDMHASRRGPSDAAMFAESTVRHDEAVRVLTARRRDFALIDWEKDLLDRSRMWAGTGGRTLRDLGHGYLGEYDRHVKHHINALAALGDHTCVADPLVVYLVHQALMYGRRHKGMPSWPVIVERIVRLLADPEHPRWGQSGRGARAVATMPAQVSSLDALRVALLSEPAALPVEVLEWLSDHLLYCAGPPYTYGADESWDSVAPRCVPRTE